MKPTDAPMSIAAPPLAPAFAQKSARLLAREIMLETGAEAVRFREHASGQTTVRLFELVKPYGTARHRPRTYTATVDHADVDPTAADVIVNARILDDIADGAIARLQAEVKRFASETHVTPEFGFSLGRAFTWCAIGHALEPLTLEQALERIGALAEKPGTDRRLIESLMLASAFGSPELIPSKGTATQGSAFYFSTLHVTGLLTSAHNLRWEKRRAPIQAIEAELAAAKARLVRAEQAFDHAAAGKKAGGFGADVVAHAMKTLDECKNAVGDLERRLAKEHGHFLGMRNRWHLDPSKTAISDLGGDAA